MPAPAFLPSLDGQAESCWRMPRSRLRTAWKSRWVDAGREQREARSRRRARPFFSCCQLLLPVACAQRHAAPLTQKTGKVASAGSHVAPASEVLRVQLHEAAAQGGKGLVGFRSSQALISEKRARGRCWRCHPTGQAHPPLQAKPAARLARKRPLRRRAAGPGFCDGPWMAWVFITLKTPRQWIKNCPHAACGRADEAMKGQWRGKAMAPCTSRQAASCQGHEFASALIAGGLSGISADGIFNGLNLLLFLMRCVPECAGGKQTGKRADHGASRNPPPHLPPAGLADPAALPHSRRSSRGRWRIQRAITGRPRACCTCWLRLLFVRPSMPLADCSSRPGAALRSEPTAECQTANARRGGAASPEGAGWRVVIGFGSPAGRRTPRGPLVSKRQTGALTALHASSATGQAKAAPCR